MSDNVEKWEGRAYEYGYTWGPPATPANGEQVERAGWRLVPVDLTQEMLDATCATDADDTTMRAAWAELLRTAPKPSTPTEDALTRVKVLEEALDRAAGVLEWLADSSPSCFGYEGPFPSTTSSISLEAKIARTSLGNMETDRHG